METTDGKAHRPPTDDEVAAAREAETALEGVFAEFPFGVPCEPLPSKEALGFRVPLSGCDLWSKRLTPRQLLMLGTFVATQRWAIEESAFARMPSEWREAIAAYLGARLIRPADRSGVITSWATGRELLRKNFARFALPIVWDFAEPQPDADRSRGYGQALEWVEEAVEHLLQAESAAPASHCGRDSAIAAATDTFDVILSDPPYYDAIPNSDLIDFFYVWLRRAL